MAQRWCGFHKRGQGGKPPDVGVAIRLQNHQTFSSRAATACGICFRVTNLYSKYYFTNICNLDHVKVIKKGSSFVSKIQTSIDLSNTKEKKGFFREYPVSLFQIKMDDRKSVNPVGYSNFAGTISVTGSLN